MNYQINTRLILSFLLFLCTNTFAQTYVLEAKAVPDPRIAEEHMGHHGGNGIDGDFAVGGAHYANEGGIDHCGAAYLFHWNDSSCIWEEVDKILPESAIGTLDLEADAEFGLTVAISNGIMAIGADQYDNDGIEDAGIVYIYRIVGTTAEFVERLVPFKNDGVTPDREINAFYGNSLKMHGNRLIVGAPNEREKALDIDVGGAGAAYIYEWNGSSFDFEQKITDPVRMGGDQFGTDVTIFGNFATVSAQGEDFDVLELDEKIDAGAIFVFELNTSTDVWEFNQKLVASDRTAGDWFGGSIDMTQEKIVVGARKNETDELEADALSQAGAAYVFDNELSIFSFEQKLVASVRDVDDLFGWRVAIHNNTIIVGAPGQSTNEFDDVAPDVFGAGAGYVYTVTGAVWTQIQKLVAYDRQGFDQLGQAAAITDDRIMLGAFGQSLNEVGAGPVVSNAGAIYVFNTGGKPVVSEIIIDQDGACTNTPVTLTIDGVLYDADHWEWHQDNCDGPILGTGVSLEVNPVVTTTYCARAIGCFNYIEPEDCHCVDVDVKAGNWHQTTIAGQREEGNDVVTDSDGNVYVTGSYTGFAVFDGGDNSDVTADAFPGPTSAIKSYVAKYDNCGNLMWVTYAEGDGTNDWANEIAIRESGGYLFIVGEFENSITFVNGIGDFGFGTGTVSEARAGKNGYIARINIVNGKVDFVDAVWSSGNSSNLTAITINENNGKIFVAGQTYDAVGYEKVFIRKYVPSYSTIGTPRWQQQSWNYNGAIVNGMDFDENADVDGALWIIGTFRKSFGIPSGIGPSFPTIGASFAERDAFVLKYFDENTGGVIDTPMGDFLKKGNLDSGTGVWVEGNDIVVDETTGNAYLVGTKRGDVHDAFSLTSHDLLGADNRSMGYFVSMRYDGGIAPAELAETSTPPAIGAQNSYGYGVDVINGTAYFTGSRKGQVYFDFSAEPLSTLFFTGEEYDEHLYIVAYNTVDGSYEWSNGTKNEFPLIEDEVARHTPGAIIHDSFGHLFIVGSYQAAMGYILGDPASGDLYYGSNGGSLFAMRVDIEGADEEALQSPAYDPHFETEVELQFIDNVGTNFNLGAIEIVPNPASKMVEIKLNNSNLNSDYQINISSSDGRVVFTGLLSKMTTLIDLSNYTSGLYIVRVFNENENYTGKLIKTD